MRVKKFDKIPTNFEKKVKDMYNIYNTMRISERIAVLTILRKNLTSSKIKQIKE